MKICTTIEQSKKLIELGIDVNTADMMWDDWRLIDEGWKLIAGYYPEIEKHYGRKCYPAWSLTALIELMGECRMERTPLDQSGAFTHSFVDDYYNIRTFEEDNAVDAAVEMILKLHEQKLI